MISILKKIEGQRPKIWNSYKSSTQDLSYFSYELQLLILTLKMYLKNLDKDKMRGKVDGSQFKATDGLQPMYWSTEKANVNTESITLNNILAGGSQLLDCRRVGLPRPEQPPGVQADSLALSLLCHLTKPINCRWSSRATRLPSATRCTRPTGQCTAV